ncbi:MAG: GntR family transcriptional regulator [Erythrobacter sp.]|nr:GntR family transcriptional regulator [Erythrobacter sp.]
MNVATQATTHHGIREAIRARIVAGEWELGELIPGEADFAAQYACARTTVNRALQALAREGIVERKRKGGTRVRPLPLPQALLRIPIIRAEVEAMGQTYDHRIMRRERSIAPGEVAKRMQLAQNHELIHLETLHLADGHPFAFERRWVNPATVPEFEGADLTAISANEWLIRTVPFSRGEASLSAVSADADLARALEVAQGAALFTLERATWFDAQSVTFTRLHYHQGYRLNFEL